VNAEFQWWLLILGMVIGGALVYLVLADMRADEETEDWLGDEEPPAPVEEDGRTTDDPGPIDPVRATVVDRPGG
jgi:hypothetical protein